MRHFLLLLVIAFSRPVYSQSYEFTLPSNEIGWHLGFAMKGVTVEPERIIIHTQHHNKFQTRTVDIPPTIMLYIPSIYKEVPVSNIIGAGIGVNTFKFGKKYAIDFVVNFNWQDLIKYSDNPLFIMDILTMRLTTDPEFVENTPRYQKNEWRFDFKIPLSYEQQLTLAAGACLSRLLVKDEFESTAAYKTRTQPDSLRFRLSEKLPSLVGIIVRYDFAKIDKLKPAFSYDADGGFFTVDYGTTVTRPVQIKVPVSEAKEIKEGIAAGRYWVKIGSAWPSVDGSLFIGDIIIQDAKDRFKSNIYQNILTAKQPESLEWLFARTIEALIKKHPQGKMLKG